MDWGRINYLNHGNSWNVLSSIFDFECDYITKNELVYKLREVGKINEYLEEIVKSYSGRKARRINLQDIKRDIENSIKFRKKFSKLGCRGFSYILHESISISGPVLANDINFRIALMPNEELFYPPRIRRYLRRCWHNHYLIDGYPSICFALGKIIDGSCYIIIMQSDLLCKKPSFIKEHFRGWRKILMTVIIQSINTKCESIYLINAHDVKRCCHPEFHRPEKTPEIWREIYDFTASDFLFSTKRLPKPVNVQLYRNLKPVLINKFYKLKLDSID